MILNSENNDATPVEILSDKAHFEEKTGETHHEGNVRVTQGNRILWADALMIHRSKQGKIDHIKALGSPAHFWSKSQEDNSELKGHADIIHYYPLDEKLVLLEHAALSQETQSIEGPELIYLLKTKTLVSHSSERDKTLLIFK